MGGSLLEGLPVMDAMVVVDRIVTAMEVVMGAA